MDSRERTFLALERRPGDRIPIDFWASQLQVRKIEKGFGCSYERFLDRYDVDLRYIEGPRYIGPPLEAGRDIWGVERVSAQVGAGDEREAYSEVAVSPLADAETVGDIRAYARWPSPDCFDYGGIEAQCDAIRERGRVAVFMGDRLNRVAQLKPAMYLRGGEDIFLDLLVRPEMAEVLFEKIRAFYRVYLTRILDASRGKIDIVLTGDDFGAQHSLLVSPDMWRHFLRPGFAEYVAIVRGFGAKAMHHTCGSVRAIVPDLIDCGLDILQSLQPEAAGMDAAALKAAFGDRLCFHGGISIQRTMPFGSPADVRGAVRRIAELFRNDGGYIFCTSHNVQADTPLENVEALLDAYHAYGATEPQTGGMS